MGWGKKKQSTAVPFGSWRGKRINPLEKTERKMKRDRADLSVSLKRSGKWQGSFGGGRNINSDGRDFRNREKHTRHSQRKNRRGEDPSFKLVE